MWECVNCENVVEGKYNNCWKCETRNVRRVLTREEAIEDRKRAIPHFSSYEELAPPPPKHKESWKETLFNPWIDALIGAVLASSLKPTFGAYGTYVAIAFGICVLIFILWNHFHKDPTEGVGIKLN